MTTEWLDVALVTKRGRVIGSRPRPNALYLAYMARVGPDPASYCFDATKLENSPVAMTVQTKIARTGALYLQEDDHTKVAVVIVEDPDDAFSGTLATWSSIPAPFDKFVDRNGHVAAHMAWALADAYYQRGARG